MKFIEISAIELNCDYLFSWFDGYNCKAENLTIQSPNLKIIKVIGERAKEFSVVDTFDVHDNPSITYLPIGLNDHFPQLKKLDVQYSSLRFISKNDFYDLNVLEIIDFRGNQIETIPSDVFSTLLKLENLNLSRNKITKIYPSTFENLRNLEELYLEDNQIEELDGNLFKNNLELKKISLSRNRLKKIGPKLVSQLMKLSKIKFVGDENCIKNNYVLNSDVKSSLLTVENDLQASCENIIEVSYKTFEEYKSNLKKLDTQVSTLQLEKNNLNQELVKEKKNLEDTKSELQQKIDQMKTEYSHTVDQQNRTYQFEMQSLRNDSIQNMTQLHTEIENLKKPQTTLIATPQTDMIQNSRTSNSNVFNSVNLTLILCSGFLIFILIILLILSIRSSKNSVHNIETTLVMTEKRKSTNFS